MQEFIDAHSKSNPRSSDENASQRAKAAENLKRQKRAIYVKAIGSVAAIAVTVGGAPVVARQIESGINNGAALASNGAVSGFDAVKHTVEGALDAPYDEVNAQRAHDLEQTPKGDIPVPLATGDQPH